MPPFNVISRRSTPEIVLSRKKIKFCKMANCIIVDIVNYVITGKILATHLYFFFTELG